MFIKWLLGRSPTRWLDEQQTDYRSLGVPKGTADEAVAAEYETVVHGVLRNWGVPAECTEVAIHQMGETTNGRKIFVAAIRLISWERKAGLRMLLGLPFLERKIRKTIGAHWVVEVSHFAGVWLHVADRVNDMGAQADLRPLLVTLTQHKRPANSEPTGSTLGSDPEDDTR